jgi:TolB-like protein/AraC-like DNA-binding protein
MDEAFIIQLKQIILNHLEDDQFGVSNLASEVGLSRSQLLRKVKKSIGISANQLINNIRLEEGAKRIKETDDTVSEIAYQVGFSSPSYFSKCFQRVFGCTPGEFKNHVGEIIVDLNVYSKPAKNNKLSLFNIILLSLAGILFAVFTYGLIINQFYIENELQTKIPSIAVLPLLNLSENKTQDYVTDGITEAITFELSKYDSIRVISRTSAMMYKDEKISSSKIAKELGVDYIMEGSVLYFTDSLRVTIQLIKPFPKEKHIYSKVYNLPFSDKLKLVGDVSINIAKNIGLTVNE